MRLFADGSIGDPTDTHIAPAIAEGRLGQLRHELGVVELSIGQLGPASSCGDIHPDAGVIVLIVSRPDEKLNGFAW